MGGGKELTVEGRAKSNVFVEVYVEAGHERIKIARKTGRAT